LIRIAGHFPHGGLEATSIFICPAKAVESGNTLSVAIRPTA